jgi:hypothetical protein
MLLPVAGFLMLLGFGTWVVGVVFEYAGIAVIGATVILGVGAMFTATGLEYRAGQVDDHEVQQHHASNDTELAVNQTESRDVYKAVALPTRLPLGLLVMILGGTGVLRALEFAGDQ